VYAALGLEWNPSTAASVADELPGVTLDDVETALVEGLRDVYDIDEAPLDPATLEIARRLAPEHRSPS
jgi:lipoate-protein ligase A